MAQQTPASSFDFSSVPVEKTTDLDGQSKSNRDPKANPFYAPLAESRANKGEGRKVTVPANVGAKTLYLIRQAADDQKIGARVVVKDNKGNVISPVRTIKNKAGQVTQKGTTMTDELKKLRGNVTVLFAAQDRKKSKKAEKAEAEAAAQNGTPETPEAAPAASETAAPSTPAPANA